MRRRDLYRMRLSAVPEQGRCSVLELEPWQQEELDELVDTVLTDRQWQAIDEAQIRNATALLVDQAEEHLDGRR
jgi:hypothetical protein